MKSSEALTFSKATTLIEMLIAIALLSIFFTMIASLYVRGFHVFSSTRADIANFRENSMAFEAMTREISQCEKIYSPKDGTLKASKLLEGYSPLRSENTPFLFVKHNSETGIEEIIGYTLDPQTSSVSRMLYGPSFDPSNPETWQVQSEKKWASKLTQFKVTLFTPQESMPNTQLIQINWISSSKSLPWETKVRIQGGF